MIFRFILFFLLAPVFAIVAHAIGSGQDDFRIVDAGIPTESVILERVDSGIYSYDSSGALLHLSKSIDGEDDLSQYQELETSGTAQSPFSFLAELVAANRGSGLFDDTLRQVDNLDFSTPRNKSVFYSGPGNRSRALSFADDTGGVPIDFTPGGKYLESLDLYSRLPATQADAIWSAASRNYATGASGKVNLFTRGARSDRVFRTVEEPILNSNIDVYKWTFHY